MADSEALRARRARRHKSGDHSLCRRCAAVTGGVPPLAAVLELPGAAKLDADAEMRRLALRLSAAHENDPSNALLARELRMTLAELRPKGKSNADADLTGLFAALQA